MIREFGSVSQSKQWQRGNNRQELGAVLELGNACLTVEKPMQSRLPEELKGCARTAMYDRRSQMLAVIVSYTGHMAISQVVK
jgi:hypothetical protein